MWQKITLNDLRVIGHYIGVLILFASIAFLIPLFTALVFGEWEPASRYLFGAGLALCVGGSLRFLKVSPGKLNRRQALIITGLSWIILALIGAIPLVMSYHYATYLDALYDCVAALTTTGSTIVIDIDHMSYADNMFRFMELLIGGVGLVVVVLSLGLFGRSSGSTLFNSEGRDEHMLPNIVNTTRFIAKVVIINILIAGTIIAILCGFKGIEPVRSALSGLWLAISGFVTGGFTPNSMSVMYYHSFPIEMVLMMLMILGSISFVLHATVIKGDIREFFKDIEIRTMIIWVLVIAVVFTASTSAVGSFKTLPALLRRGTFMIVAAFTTTGLQNITTNELNTVLTSGAFVTLAVAMAVGGSAGSTSGGIKFRRVGIAFLVIKGRIKEALAPDSVRITTTYHHLGRRVIDQRAARDAMTVFILFVATYIIGALIGIAYGYDATHALFESITMASNGGLASIATPDMPIPLVLTYIFEMWAGRLEFVTLIALIAQLVISAVPRKRKRKVVVDATQDVIQQ